MANKEGVGRSIPDSDLEGWKKTYKEGGFSDKETDEILIRTNEKYREKRIAEMVEEKLHGLEKVIHEKLSPKEREGKRTIFEARVRKELGL